jgi:predicted dehydrogenase
MSLYTSPEQREAGQKNYADAVINRRTFMKGFMAAAGAAAVVTPAAYFGYKALEGNPVKAGLIGAGDEGGVLVGCHQPEFLHFIAYSDIRPFNQERIFKGEPTGFRKGFNYFYGKDADKQIKLYKDYRELLDNPDIEAVVIALPLHLHAPVAIEAMRKGKHVLCEKLMAWNIASCKEMIKVAEETDRILTIGHQRHYSLLYAHAVELLQADRAAEDADKIIGDIRHIRALWHRNNSWPYVAPTGPNAKKLAEGVPQPKIRDGWYPPIYEEDYAALANDIKKYGYKDMQELVRWRLYDRTGGGLMAELGSHQLDACSIFLRKVHPLAVQGVGGKFYYRDGEPGRQADDGVFVTFEFPGPNYYEKDNDGNPTHTVKDRDDIVVVTYSSVNTNSFEPYGECVMGSRGTLLVEKEETIMLFPERNPNPKKSEKPVEVTAATAGGGKPAVDSSGSTGALAPAAVPGATAGGPPSRGYTEEMAHFAFCVRMHQRAKDKEEKEKWRLTPRCHGKVAMADAIIALTSNQAMRQRKRVEFQAAWFDPKSAEVPDKDMVPTDADGKKLA